MTTAAWPRALSTARSRSATVSALGVANLLERLFRKLGLEGEHEPRGGFSRGVGDDVELDGGVGHPERG